MLQKIYDKIKKRNITREVYIELQAKEGSELPSPEHVRSHFHTWENFVKKYNELAQKQVVVRKEKDVKTK